MKISKQKEYKTAVDWTFANVRFALQLQYHETVKRVRPTSSKQWHNVYKYLYVCWTRPFLRDAAVIEKENRGLIGALVLPIIGLHDPVQVT